MNDPRQLTVRVQTLNGQWEVIGANRRRGVVPESVQLSANEWGPDQCSFVLNDQVGTLRSDLAAWTPVEVDVAGQTVWDGRIKETPTHDAANGRTISVQAEGWQYHLDDDVYEQVYVHTRLSDWRDAKSFLTQDLVRFTQAGQVSADGGVTIGWPKGTEIPSNITRVGAMLDLGTSRARKIVIDWEHSNSLANINEYVYAADGEQIITDPGVESSTAVANNNGVTTGQTILTPTNPHRYVAVVMHWTAAAATTTADAWLKITGARVFSSTAYESGGVSILKADTILKDAIVQATDLFSIDTSGIVAGSVTIAEFAVGLVSAREAWQAANAYENYDTRIEVGRRPVFRPRPTAAVYEIGEWAGADFQDASVNSGQDIYNRALVQGTGPDGAALTVERTTTGTMADRRNFRRTKILPISTPITTPVGQRFGDLFLAAHATTPFRGGFQTVGQGGIRRVVGGGSPHPAWLLRDTTQLVRCPVVDVDTGDWTRDARMVTVMYDHANLASTISLDEDREGFDTLLARYALAVGQR